MSPTARVLSNSQFLSPLRYPGGKQILSRVLLQLLSMNGARGGTYAEPYAGGAGAALSLLFGEHVDRILINDADRNVFAFWSALLTETDAFVDLVKSTPVNVTEWRRQRWIYKRGRRATALQLGFATFFLNRCNRSGIIGSGGLIGGKDQTGPWLLDARFNRDNLVARIRRVAAYRDRITVTNVDALDFLRNYVAGHRRPFVYLDPPYYGKGSDLYLNYYKPEDHAGLAAVLAKGLPYPWVLSYDDVAAVLRLYQGMRSVRFSLRYTAQDRRAGRELLIFHQALRFPVEWKASIPKTAMGSEAYHRRMGHRVRAVAG